ncbi:Rne/Rng family ribonuclease [Azospirillum thermophilum]|uniref:Ribonuclease E n=1 Tax=Azospirillum thermophilum TaxID=2202148 RepID=A0A2S2CQ84_9PROT|nr:ribonuclease E/G [Azospirillum thermophilum]AWK86540.1 ribonuclease E/G [Azospirillum thermophilum]
MAKRMLVDATHPEEIRVAVVNGNRLEDLDFEIASRKQLKGNIYLAKVTRVEPSLQAAFVEYGGNRHGFLAFSEIHPDYYRIPIADREALLAEERRLEEQAEARAEAAADGAVMAEPVRPEQVVEEWSPMPSPIGGDNDAADGDLEAGDDETGAEDNGVDLAGSDEGGSDEGDAGAEAAAAPENPDVIGGDEVDEVQRRRPRPLRSYKIQEVIKRRQVMLVQVTKEERGNKGAALTTYLSLPGRYCVLMPNTGRGGGISRKITNPADRKRLKEILSDLDIPDGMAVILRTAGLERSKPEIKRDLEYLLRLWDDIREQTLKSTAPCLIYEEANLIKRSIRDLYSNDIDEIWVEGEGGFRTAQDFMGMLMPSHVNRVQLYRDTSIPLFHRYQVETQIEAIHSPVVQLRSGGYIVINPTEALVAIDVNSGKSTRERNIEETAYKTNLEAAEEVARQLRLRDLAGLIVIDFIDMEESRNNAAVERRLKEAMKNDRARIQLGRISAFGLLELSRQRLRPSLLETNFERCPHCAGTGVVRSVESAALHVLRAIEEEGIRRRSSEITVAVPTSIALYILNQKRGELAKIEERHGLRVMVQADDTLIAPDHRLERVRARTGAEEGPLVSADRVLAETDRVLAAESAEQAAAELEADEEGDEEAEGEGAERSEAEANGGSETERRRRRRRRRGRGRGERDEGRTGEEAGSEAAAEGIAADSVSEEGVAADASAGEADADADADEDGEDEGAPEGVEAGDRAGGERKKRRRGKRGGRRRPRREGAEGLEAGQAAGSEDAPVEAAPAQADVRPQPAPAAEVDDLDYILTGEEPAEAAAPEVPADTAVAAAEAPAVAEEAPAKAAKRPSRKAPAAKAPEAKAPAKKASTRGGRKAAKETPAEAPAAAAPAAPADAPVDAEAATEKAPARKRSSKKAKSAAAEAPAEAPVAAAPVEQAAPAAAPAKKRSSRKAKGGAAEAPAEAAPAPAAVEAAPAAEAAKKRPARKRKTAAEAPAEAAPAPAISEPVPAPAAGPTPAPDAEAPAPAGKPRRGWWQR